MDRVHITSNCEGKRQTKKPFLRIAFVPAAYPIHAAVIPIGNAFFKAGKVIVSGIQNCGQALLELAVRQRSDTCLKVGDVADSVRVSSLDYIQHSSRERFCPNIGWIAIRGA